MLWRVLSKRSLWILFLVICAVFYVWTMTQKELQHSKETRGILETGVEENRPQKRAVVRTEEKNVIPRPEENERSNSSSETYKLGLVMGIPSIKRPGGTVYLIETLDFVVRKRRNFDNVIFVVYLAETDDKWREEMTEMVTSKFSSEINSGLIQIIHPPKDLYPDWDKEMKITLGDPRHQVQWRSKQNLDQSYLMSYAHSLNPKYYIGIEDDVSAVDDYLSAIFNHAESAFSTRDDILFISYCKWGAIGKLFHFKMLPTVSNYLKIFWNYKPLDWLYWDLQRTLACRYPLTNCDKEAGAIVLNYKDELFDHKGKVSSLDKSIKS